MNHVPPDLKRMIDETERLFSEIRLLRGKDRPTVAELRKLAVLRAELLRTCPPERYAWLNGLPVIDILKTLNQQEEKTQ